MAKPTFNAITDAQIEALIQKSIKTMPNSPSSKGYSPEVIKNRLVNYVLDTSDENSIIKIIQSIITDLNTAFTTTYNDIGSGAIPMTNANLTTPTISNPTISTGTSTGMHMYSPTIDKVVQEGVTISTPVINDASIVRPSISYGTATNLTITGGTQTGIHRNGGDINKFASSSSRTEAMRMDITDSTIEDSSLDDVTTTNKTPTDISGTYESSTEVINQKYVDDQAKKILDGTYSVKYAKDYVNGGTIQTKISDIEDNIDNIEDDIGDMDDLSDADVVSAINTIKTNKATTSSLSISYNTSNGNVSLMYGSEVLSTIDLPTESVFVVSGDYAPSVVEVSNKPYLRLYLVSDTTHTNPVDIALDTIFSSALFGDTTTIDYDYSNNKVTFSVKNGSIDYNQVSARLKAVIDKVEDEFGASTDAPASDGTMWARFLYMLGNSSQSASSTGSMWQRYLSTESDIETAYTTAEATRNTSYNTAEGTNESVAGTTSRWGKFFYDLGTNGDVASSTGNMWARFKYNLGTPSDVGDNTGSMWARINYILSDVPQAFIQRSNIDTSYPSSPSDSHIMSSKLADATFTHKSGTYDSLTSGSAKQLNASVGTTNTTPYTYRASADNVSIGNRVSESIVGASVVWNQLVQNGNFASADNWNKTSGATLEIANNIATYTSVATSTNRIFQSLSETIPANHKVLISFDFKSDGTDLALRYGVNNSYSIASGTDSVVISASRIASYTSWTRIETIMSRSIDCTHLTIGSLSNAPAGIVWQFKNINIFDLTKAFGTTIANSITTTQFKSLFPNTYYAYNTGEIKSVDINKKANVGFNQWDEQWEVGNWKSDDGTKGTINDRIRSKNHIQVLPNTTYYYKGPTIAGSGRCCAYDSNKTFIGVITTTGSVSGYFNYNKTFTTPANCHYITFNCASDYGTTYNNDICINLSHNGSKNGTYLPYQAYEYPMNAGVLRGLYKLDANNVIYADGDEYTYDGKIKRKYGYVDLGTLTWERFQNANNNYAFRTNFSYGHRYNFLTPNYSVQSEGSGGYDNLTNKEMCGRDSSAIIYIRDDSYTDAASFKTAMSGIYLIYELANPTEETAPSFAENQVVNDWGTESFIQNNSGFLPVGHNSLYQSNLRDKLQNLPNNTTSGTYNLIHQNGSQQELYAFNPSTKQDTLPNATSTLNKVLRPSNTSGGVEWGNPLDLEDSGFVTYNHQTGAYEVDGDEYALKDQFDETKQQVLDHEARVTNIESALSGSVITETTIENVGSQEMPQYVLPYGRLNKLGGLTKKWNQFIGTLPATQTISGITFTNNDDGSITINGTATANATITFASSLNIPNGHKVASFIGYSVQQTGIRIRYYNSSSQEIKDSYYNEIFTLTDSIASAILRVDNATTISNKEVIPMLVDLTAIYGSGNEPASVSTFLSDYPIFNSYVAYTTGSLSYNKPSSVSVVGVNKWDEEWEVGGISYSTGQNISDSSRIRSKNYIPLLPSTAYYISTNRWQYLLAYDYNKNFIGVLTTGNFTTKTNQYYLRFCLEAGYGTTYNNDITINISNASLNGTYYPYVASNLLASQLTAINTRLTNQGYDLGYGIDKDNCNYIDFASKKAIINYSGKVFNGTDEFTPYDEGTDTYRFRINFTDAKSSGAKGLCNKLNWVTSGVSSDVELIGVSSNKLYIRVNKSKLSAFTSAALNEWLVNNSVSFTYELATPIQVDLSDILTNSDSLVPNLQHTGSVTPVNAYKLPIKMTINKKVVE